jgi:class 3 adenylate cyclase/tetratricopeptide (TPR) repeat protein
MPPVIEASSEPVRSRVVNPRRRGVEGSVLCASCGKENRDDARFCRGCGTPLAIRCPACGAEQADDATFCDRCGARVGVPPAAPTPSSYTPAHLAARIRASRAALEGERKLVTVLFADVVGSTSIAERIGPEEMRALMDRCFGRMLEEVHRYEGTVNQFTGDGIMALFGAPLALEDAPRRAVLSALGIQRALARDRAELRETWQTDLQVRIGIHTGLVVVGRIGNDLRMEYTAIGDTTNLAARLQSIAAPGSIVVSEATHRLAGAFFRSRDLGVQAIKGKSEAVHVFEVLGESEARSRLDAAASGLTPFTGRASQLARLAEALGAADAGRGQVVFLVGEAGIGKSRLLHEFRGTLRERPHAWIEGRCASYGATTAFFPIVDAFRRSFGIDDRDAEDVVLAKTDAAVPEDLAWARPLVRLLLSLPPGDATAEALDAPTRRSETMRALKALTLRIAESRPLVLVVEDLHFLLDSVPAARILVVLTHRPGYRHPFGDRSYHRRLVLDGLPASDMATMAMAILDAAEIPEALRDLVAAKAEGNPLFVEEVTKSLLEDGTLRREGDRIVLARDAADVAVPDSIHGVLMARLDRLDDNPKRALQMASVIGREFALRLLARVSEVGEHLSSLLSELRGLELIYEKAAHPELAYMFKHALTHDVAYESILVQRRKALHRTIGLAIEELYGDRLAEHYETLALHFERGEDWERAFAYHRKAAAKSLAVYANQAAIAHCRGALTVAEHLGDHVTAADRRELEEMLGAAHMSVTEFRASGEALVRAAEAAEDPLHRTLDLSWAAHSFLWAHEYASSSRVLREAMVIAEAHHLPAGRALALAVRAFTGGVTDGDLAAHWRLAEEAVQLAAGTAQDDVQAFALFMVGEAQEWSGECAAAIRTQERCLAIGRRIGNPFLTVMSMWWLGKAHTGLGQYEVALDALRDAEALCARLGNRAWRSRLLNTTGWALAEVGDPAAARPFNLEAARLARELGDPEILANSEINLAMNHLDLGDADRAAALLAALEAMIDGDGDPWMRWRYTLHIHDATARVALVRRDPERALAHAEVEVHGAQRHATGRIAARALVSRARALVALDRRADAERAVDEALAAAERVRYPPAQWRALGLKAELARRAGRLRDAEAAVARATALVTGVARTLRGDLRRTLLAAAHSDTRPASSG